MKTPKIVKDDPWLNPYKDVIVKRMQNCAETEAKLTGNGKTTLFDFANGHLFYGTFSNGTTTTVREWLPNAMRVTLIGDVNGWQESHDFDFKPLNDGNWELQLPADKFGHGSLFRLKVYWSGGE